MERRGKKKAGMPISNYLNAYINNNIRYTFPAADILYPSSVSGSENSLSASSTVQIDSGQILRWSRINGCMVAEALFPAKYKILNEFIYK